MNTSKSVADSLYGNKGGGVRVKDTSEKWCSKRYTGKHAKTGQVVLDSAGHEVELNSELDNAKLGVLVKHLASKSLGNIIVEPHERQLLDEMATKDSWCGDLGGEYFGQIDDAGSGQVKALLDDATSGGLEIAPIAVDQRIVTFPLLHGELYPWIDAMDLARGRRVEGSSIANVTINSGAGDNVEANLLTTTGMVSAIDTNVFACDVAIEVGRDFMSDSIVEIGRILQELIGSKAAAWLDEQIAIGDGTTEPEGLTVASGIATVTPDNTTTGPPTLEDVYDLQFGIGKQYRQPALQPSYISNDVSYSRSRGIRVDPHNAATTVNQLPVFGIDAVNSYRTLDWPHRIQNNIPNGTTIFGCLKKYRMYRRASLSITVETGGTTLTRKNLALVMARMRFGGKVIDASAFCKWTNGQS